MKRFLSFVCALCSTANLASALDLPAEIELQNDGPRDVTVTFHSKAVANGSLPGLASGLLSVVLPRSYDSAPSRRYPVVYTFHGYGDDVTQLNQVIDPLLEAHPEIPEVILVGVYGGNSFYANSKVTGQVSSMIVDEVVPLVDARFRTVATARGRILAGFSMGGFAAWTLALAHADLFSSAWICCPGAFDENGAKDAAVQWRSGMLSDYVAAFAPDHYDAKTRTASSPRFDQTPTDNAYVAQLQRGFGDVEGKLATYRAKGVPLVALRFDYGADDYFAWIARGTASVAGVLKKAGLPVKLVSWPANHEFTEEMLEQGLLPLIASTP